MSDGEQQPLGPGFERFRLKCPNCNEQGTRHRPRMGVRGYARRDGRQSPAVGTGYIPETCPDCGGAGYLPLGSEEWKGRPESDPPD
jgi:DnaJ-class molecular chaperone